MNSYEVTVGAGSRRSATASAVAFAHVWTPEGVSVEADFTGAHLLHLAAAGCVLNDVYREAAAKGIEVTGVQVSANGGFDPATWRSTGITYTVEIDSPASPADLAALLATVDSVAEIPRALRTGTTVARVEPDAGHDRSAGSAEVAPQ